jgi:hypothetical protein
MAGIRVTVEDLETGERASQEIANDYVIVCAGSCHVAHVQDYPGKGTQVLTVKGRNGLGGERTGSAADAGGRS